MMMSMLQYWSGTATHQASSIPFSSTVPALPQHAQSHTHKLGFARIAQVGLESRGAHAPNAPLNKRLSFLNRILKRQ